jgi:hypothetical protein
MAVEGRVQRKIFRPYSRGIAHGMEIYIIRVFIIFIIQDVS